MRYILLALFILSGCAASEETKKSVSECQAKCGEYSAISADPCTCDMRWKYPK